MWVPCPVLLADSQQRLLHCTCERGSDLRNLNSVRHNPLPSAFGQYIGMGNRLVNCAVHCVVHESARLLPPLSLPPPLHRVLPPPLPPPPLPPPPQVSEDGKMMVGGKERASFVKLPDKELETSSTVFALMKQLTDLAGLAWLKVQTQASLQASGARDASSGTARDAAADAVRQY
jgi:hypothetical protein